jgi:hypothetical protein
VAQADPVSTPASTLGRPVGPVLRAQARLLDGEESDRAAHLLAAGTRSCAEGSCPGYHRRRRWTTRQYKLEPPDSGASGAPGDQP